MARAVPAETHLAGAWKLRIPAALVWGRARPIGTRGFRDFEGRFRSVDLNVDVNECVSWEEVTSNEGAGC
jgi:hypothetical protein